MRIDDFISLNIAFGHKIIKTKNCSWIIISKQYAHNFPSLENVYPDKSDFKEVFNSGVKLLLFKTEINTPNTVEYIFKGTEYHIETFKTKIRNEIRNSLKSCNVHKPSLETLKVDGFKINKSTLSKHDRSVPYLSDEKLWNKYCDVLYDKQDVHILGSFVDNVLSAYSIFFKVENKYYIYHPFTNYEYSKHHPLMALFFVFINQIITTEGFIYISYGIASFSDKPGLDMFKRKMNFIEDPITRIVVLNSRYSILVNSLTNWLLKICGELKIFGMKKVQTINFLFESKKWLLKYYKYLKNDKTV